MCGCPSESHGELIVERLNVDRDRLTTDSQSRRINSPKAGVRGSAADSSILRCDAPSGNFGAPVLTRAISLVTTSRTCERTCMRGTVDQSHRVQAVHNLTTTPQLITTHNQEDDRPPLRKGSLSVRTRLIGSRRYPGWLSHEFILDLRAYGSDTSMTLTHFSAVQIVCSQQGGRCAITLSFCLAPGSTVFWSPIPHYMYVAQDRPVSWFCRGSDHSTQEL